MKVTAKFTVYTIVTTDYPNGTNVRVTLIPDYSDGKNAEWAAATPSGNITLDIDPSKTSAAELFKARKALTVTFDADH